MPSVRVRARPGLWRHVAGPGEHTDDPADGRVCGAPADRLYPGGVLPLAPGPFLRAAGLRSLCRARLPGRLRAPAGSPQTVRPGSSGHQQLVLPIASGGTRVPDAGIITDKTEPAETGSGTEFM